MKLDCVFHGVSCEFWEGYSCYVSSAKITEPSTVVKEIQGDQEAGKSIEEVRGIAFNSCTVHFVPRGLEVFFSNITRLTIRGCGLKSICRDDLKQLKNLEVLWLGSNELTTLPDDLFQGTPKLTYISFWKNKIESMSSKLFDPIANNKFRFISFGFNTKIDAFYQPGDSESVASVAALMAIIDSQCSKPEPAEPQAPTNLRWINNQDFPKGFEDLFASGKFSDFVITVNDSKQFRVHRNILAAHCEGFSELFDKDLSATVMKIEDLSPEAVEQFLRYLYTGKLENVAENYLEIFRLAAKLKVSFVKTTIEKLIVDHIDNFDALKVFSLSHSFQSDQLKRAAFKAIQTNVGEGLPEDLMDNLEQVKKIVDTWKKLKCLVNKGKKLSLN